MFTYDTIPLNSPTRSVERTFATAPSPNQGSAIRLANAKATLRGNVTYLRHLHSRREPLTRSNGGFWRAWPKRRHQILRNRVSKSQDAEANCDFGGP